MIHSSAWRQLRSLLIGADAIAIVLVYILVDYFRCRLWMQTEWPEIIAGHGSTVRLHMKVLVVLPVAWPIILNWLGWYEPRPRTRTWTLRTAIAASTILVLFQAALALLLERELYPRAQIAGMFLLLPATTVGVRGITRWIGRSWDAKRASQVLIVGTERDAARLRRLVRRGPGGHRRVLGHLRGPWETGKVRIPAESLMGGVDQLGPILDSRVVDEVVFSAPLDRLAEVLPHVRLCEEIGVQAHIQAESIACHSIPHIVDLRGVPLLSYAPAQHSPEALAIKRLFDAGLAIIGIFLAAPIMVLCALLIKATSPGPILFRQVRSGLNGRTFCMLKFRTMGEHAEATRAEIAHLNESTGPVFKVAMDPRVTQIGRFLRRWSLDELPQLFNVLIGEMSVVGPRPPLPSEVAQYDRWQRRRLSMRPGLTCLWQIRGRHRIGFTQWMQLDLFYIDHWSLRLDFRIFCRTFATVLGGTGA